MQGQEAGTNLFCIYRDCEDLALFGDYCKAHQFQRAEAAEARAAELEAELNRVTTTRAHMAIEIKQLEAQLAGAAAVVETLTKERDHQMALVNSWVAAYDMLKTDRDQLRAEAEKLNAVIRGLADRLSEVTA